MASPAYSHFSGTREIVKLRGLPAERLPGLLGAVLMALVPVFPCAAQYYPNVSGTTPSPVDIPQTNLTPITSPFGAYGGPGSPLTGPATAYPPAAYNAPLGPAPTPPSVSLGNPLFDPYSTGTNPGTYAPAIQGLPPVSSPQFPGWLPGAGGQGGFSGALPVAPYGTGTTTYGNTAFPPEAYPSNSPNTLFPGGIFSGGSFAGASGAAYNPYRRFQGPRIRYTYLHDGDGPDDLEMNDIDTSLVFAFQNFLYSGQPLFVLPSFGLHLLDGPDGKNGSDLPPQVYDAFLDAGWQSDPAQLLGADVGLRVGVFSDFDTTNSDSLRILGKGLVTFRLTPYTTLKGGVYYLDRNRVKLLPAGGLVYQPTPLTRFDIFFPQPKLAQYCRTIGTQDVWGYLAADYGGGNWSITRDNGEEDSVDINDIRVMVGLEWGRNDLIRAGKHTGFFEVGYVFEREVLYKENSSDNFNPGSTFMLRMGFGY